LAGRGVLSPSGSHIALVDQANNGIWLVGSEGSSPPVRLTSPVDRTAFGAALSREAFVPMWTGHPEWSPDGETLYFVTNRNAGLVELWRVAIDSKEPGGDICLYSVSEGEGELSYLVGVMADGRVLLRVHRGVVILDPSGEVVASFAFRSVIPCWSPSHDRVAILDGEVNRLYFLEGTTLTEAPELPEGLRYGSLPEGWSQDSRYFATYAVRPATTERQEVYLLILSGGSEGYTSEALVAAPEGHLFNRSCPVSWVGNSYVLAVLYSEGHYSDGAHETWAYPVGAG